MLRPNLKQLCLKQPNLKQPNLKQLASALIGITLLLMSCQQQPAPELELMTQSLTPGRLMLLQGVPMMEYSGNCTLNQLDMPEEGFRLKGSTGGLASVYMNTPSPVGRPSEVGTSLVSLGEEDGVDWLQDLEHDVAIIILDNFKGHEVAGGVYQLGEAVFNLADGSPTDLEARADALADKLDGLSEAGQLSHGALVFNHVLAVLSHVADAVAISDTTVVFKKDGHAIIVQGVDTQGFQTDAIVAELNNAIATLVGSQHVLGVPVSVQRIAVNMSFAIVPCSVLWDYQQTRNNGNAQSFEEYMALVTCVNAEQFGVACSPDAEGFQRFHDDLWQIATTPLEDDPLQTLIFRSTDLGGPHADALVFTASAGNYGDKLNYPLAPAAWPFVLSVSANNVDKDVLAEFSNPGAISMAGAWFTLPDALGRAGISAETLATTSTVYAGTSLAAPGLAVFAALDLGQTKPTCSDALLTRLKLNIKMSHWLILCVRCVESNELMVFKRHLPVGECLTG